MRDQDNLIIMEKLDSLPSETHIDVLIMAASVDKRCYAVFEKFLTNCITIDRIVILDYAKTRPMPKSSEYSEYYKLNSYPNVEYIPCNTDGYDCEYISKADFSSSSKVFIDITSISVPDIFRIFYVFKEFLKIETINVVYAEPGYYNYFNGLYFAYEEDVVEREYTPLSEYFTSAVSRDVVLVCFLGFERLISKYIHERKEHSDVIAINGFPAYYPKLKDISLAHNYELISTIGLNCVRYAQANNPFSAYNTLVEIKDSNTDKLLDICVLGSKLGACMFALRNPQIVKVSYPFPKASRVHTSIEVSNLWLYTITL